MASIAAGLLLAASTGCASTTASSAAGVPVPTSAPQTDQSSVNTPGPLPEQSRDLVAVTGAPSPQSEPVELEYARVEGKRCLEPAILRGTPGGHDYIEAEKRWLAKNHPGYSLVRQLYFLGSESKPGPAEKGGTLEQNIDSFRFVTADGRNEVVCFTLYKWNP
jgi:hypothetical protein